MDVETGGAVRSVEGDGAAPRSARHATASGHPPLPEDYYVSAFATVLDVVERRHAAMLNEAEHRWVAALRTCPEPARRLYVRLLMRRGTFFRLSRLRYDEIGDIGSAVAGLVEHGLADESAPRRLASLLRAFTVAEIDRLVDVPAGAGRRRVEKVAALLARDASADAAALAAADAWVRPLGLEHVALFRLCFFGNLHQDLGEFVLQDLGAVRYEPYALDAASGHFRSREQIERHLRHRECELAWEHLDRRDPDALRALLACLPPPYAGDAHLARRLERLGGAIARHLERLGGADEALFVYERLARPPARERRARLLVRAGRIEEARALCAAMAAAPRSEGESEFAERTFARLDGAQGRRRADGRRARLPRPWRPTTTVLTLVDDGTRVERAACAYYARSGECHWLENGLVRAVLGLFAWDIVFADVPGAFFHPFQSAPADFRDGFREGRREALDARLEELDGPDGTARLTRRVFATLASRRGTANPLVRWSRLSTEATRLAMARIPAEHWKALFDRMLDDLSEHVTGLPDLVRFPHAGGYEFIEIKGPGDALQPHQRRWLRHFDRHGIPARVVHVRRPPGRPDRQAGDVPRPSIDPERACAAPTAAPALPDAPGTCADLFAVAGGADPGSGAGACPVPGGP